MKHDTHTPSSALRPAQVDHICGHRFTHLIPVLAGDNSELLDVMEMLAMHPCPSCMAGEPDWAVGSHPGRSAGKEAGAC